MRKASIKETGEELSQAEWARFDAAVARLKAERAQRELHQQELAFPAPHVETRPSRGAAPQTF